MRTYGTLPRVTLLIAALALAVAIAAVLAIWIWPPGPSANAGLTGSTGGAAVGDTGDVDGTSESTKSPAPRREPNPEPRFESDDAALAEVEGALVDYFALNDAITADGGASADRIAEFVTPEFLPSALIEILVYSEMGLRSTGSSTIDSVALTSVTRNIDGSAEVSASVCVDTSNLTVIDIEGYEWDMSGDIARSHFMIDLEAPADRDQRRLISNSMWDFDSELCAIADSDET